jgi:hypothetical protein
METIDRRRLLGGILCGALAATGLALTPGSAEAQVVVVGSRHRHHWHHPHHRRRAQCRWVCWWHRGRRVCGWR